MLKIVKSKLKTRNHWRIRNIVVVFLLLFICCPLKAQTENADFEHDTIVIPIDTLAAHADTLAVSTETITVSADTIITPTKATSPVISDGVADPHKATLWALIPGGGQIYNWNHGDKWWLASLKLTAIYGGFGTLTYFIVMNTNDYRDFRDAYRWVSSEGINGKKNKYTDGSYSEVQLQSYMNYYQTNMEWCYFFTALLYGLQIVEATVTAHLLTFDVSDDLSFSVKPLYIPDFSPSPLNSAIGISMRYKLQYK
ncbi:MAG: DUF5683 domain-containing protein [Bacteroidales bacterium]|nr:DUF5683 domain-containing protein [Bacteroidales bacterium]